jgi:thiopeptide-type bacteriocin biosynthesis protein
MATGEFVASGFFVLRTPLLPFDELLAWGDGLEAPGTVGRSGALAGAMALDRARLRARLGELVARPQVRDALAVASPALVASVGHWLEDPESDRARRVERALVRYVTRMAANPTPFGLFAGCSTGTIGAGTTLTVGSWAAGRRHSRLDLDDLEAVAEALAKDPAIRERVRHRPNSTLYRTAGRLHYVELRRRGRERSHHLVAVAPSHHLDAALAAAADGARPAEIAAAVAGSHVTAEAAAAFVAEMIDEQVLVPDLAAPATGPEPLDGLIEQLEAIPEAGPAAATLVRARTELAAIDAGGLGADPARYRAVTETVAGLLPGREPVIRVDMVRPAPALSLGPLVVDELLRGVQLLRRLTRASRGGPIEQFATEFVQRYGKREVPLIEAVEGEAGVGLAPRKEPGGEAAPLLRGLDFPTRHDELVPWGMAQRLLLNRLVEAAGQGRHEVTLTRAEVGRLGVDELPELPDAFAVMATIVAPSAEAVDRGQFLIAIDRASGPSGARAMARFCHADPVLRRHVEAHHRAEEALDVDAVVAEVVHLPEGHLGNVFTRPLLRELEIAYLARSGAPAARQVPVSDLLVSVRQGRVELRSRRLGRRVVPRMTTAHNDERGANLYRFLAQLQADGQVRNLTLDGGPLADAPFVPRLRVGRVVLWPARWRLTSDDLRALSGLGDAELFEAVAALRERRRLPRFVVLQDDQSRLLADLDNLLSVASLAQALSGRDQAVLTELAAAPEGQCVEGPDGSFTHEIIVPFVRAAPLAARRARPLLAAPPFSRTYPPGSEWLYAKLYSGPVAADRVLLEVVAPVAAQAVASGAADRWSFLRFADPEWHLRVRFHGDAGALWDEVLPALRRALAPMLGEDGLVWRLQLDTYERTVDWSSRVEGVEVAEGIYQADSEAVVAILTLLEPGDQGEDERWRLALAGVARLLDDIGLTGPEKQAVADDLRAFFAQEFRADGRLRRQIGDRFRAQRAGLQTLIDRPWDRDHPLAPGFEILDMRSEMIAPLVPRLGGLQADGTVPRSLHTVATSLAHLHVDRLLRSAQRAQELILYDFLARLYRRPYRGS